MGAGGTPQARASATPPPAPPPRRTRNWRRATLATLITAAVVLPLSAAARPEIPAPAPATLPPLTTSTLDTAYAANRANAAEASRMAAAHGDTHRAAADRSLTTPTHHLLHFDGRGEGKVTEVLGDLTHADHIAVLVPGSDTSLDTYARFRAEATALHHELNRTTPRTAVIAWLGYQTPDTISTTVTTTGRADRAAPQLRQFIRQLRGIADQDDTTVSLLCHSYGSVVCARAATDLDATDLVLLGSPGTGADTAAALHTRARVWAARGTDDWVADVPHIKTDLFGTTVGFGTDPMSPSFGANRFAAGDGGHSDYFAPGSVSLANLARIVLGKTSEVTRA
ncbi:alpha/beta hydrolase family protein [Streptomyces sp. TLI_55]|uniref:alpha/beta hydrolase family protein n=1 Tax=Streptomyces sp. TLI_55 TaxID=1938861 RepID=UPI000BCF7B6F|nr:alpha/beta hydrolase family protein [Streptomyces sp. TLI_55]SNX62796.1 alpha/beta hydrolase family protein [Streptomyces sp. TLI_55]